LGINGPQALREARMPDSKSDGGLAGTAGRPATPVRELLVRCVRYAALAPSGHNAQPWRFRLERDRLQLYADRSRALRVVDPNDRELTISCGAALCQLRLAIRYFGFTDVVRLVPSRRDPDLLADVTIGERRPPSAQVARLFHAIPNRRSNRAAFDSRRLPRVLVDGLRASAAEDHVAFCPVAEPAWIARVADLVAAGDRSQFADRRFRRELAHWIAPSSGGRHDGIPGYALGMGKLEARAAPWVIRAFNVGKRQAKQNRRLARASAMLAVLGTADDDPRAWLATGAAMTKVLLRACAGGVATSFLNEPIEVEALRPRLRRMVRLSGYPQLLLRFGYGPTSTPTPRRGVDEILSADTETARSNDRAAPRDRAPGKTHRGRTSST
jgi:nitroreductase